MSLQLICISLGGRTKAESGATMPIRCLIFTALLSLVLAGPAHSQVGRPASVVVRDICPFECCHFGTWTARAMLELQRTPGSDTSLAFKVIPGESFAAETGELHLQSVGAAVLHYPLYVPPEGGKAAIDARTGDTVLVVGYLGEDIWLIRYRGVERDAGRFWASNGRAARPDLPGELVRPLRGQWWVHARTKEGLLGWLLAGEVSGGEGADGAISTAAVEGVDACG